MKDDDVLPTTVSSKKEASDSGLFGKDKYKFWALAAILLLALWSMFTGTVSLRWSGSLNSLSNDLDMSIHDDLDVLEMEEREKVVNHMWDVYTNSRIRLPRFWQEAFEAAYEELTSDAPGVREAAINEIAKMSVRSLEFDPPSIQSTACGNTDFTVIPGRCNKKCWGPVGTFSREYRNSARASSKLQNAKNQQALGVFKDVKKNVEQPKGLLVCTCSKCLGATRKFTKRW